MLNPEIANKWLELGVLGLVVVTLLIIILYLLRVNSQNSEKLYEIAQKNTEVMTQLTTILNERLPRR